MADWPGEVHRLMTETHCHVARVETEATEGYRADITVVRLDPGQFITERPQADDLPDDIRQALLDWAAYPEDA